MLNVHPVIGAVSIILYTEHCGVHQVVMLCQFNITGSMDFFPPADNFIGSGVINVFY